MSRNIMPTVNPKQPCTATNQILDSPYASNLHTNYTPTESEIPQIKEFLTDPLKRLSCLDAEIDRVRSILDELWHKRCALSDEIEAHRALISPIRRIPLDVLGEIFVNCLPDRRNAVMSPWEAPILLGRICSAWRSIALSTPRLWASLHIPTPTEISEIGQVLSQPDPTFIARMERRCEGAREWIGRSGESPISISVCIPSVRDSYDLEPLNMKNFEVVVAQILPSSHRWKRADFRATKDLFTRLQQLAEDDVPLLEFLVIASVPPREENAWDPPASDSGGRWTEFSGLLSARKLRNLSLSYLREDLLSLPVRWSQLTHLNLDIDMPAKVPRGTSKGPRYSDIIKVLRRCPLLVSCGFRVGITIFDVVPQPDLPLAEYTLTLPLLENLLLILSGRGDECYLKHLDLPRLRHLEIKFRDRSYGTQANRPSWVPFLSRNGDSVKKLFIDIPSLTRDELIAFLESVPHLIHLHVNSSSSSSSVVDPEVIDRLTPSAENPNYLCPMLEDLKCNGTKCASFSEFQLLSLVQKRGDSENGGVLKQVQVTFQDRAEPKNFDKFLDSLIGIGMKVSQRYKLAGAVIHPESNNTNLSTVVIFRYAGWSQYFFSPWDGQYVEGPWHFDFN